MSVVLPVHDRARWVARAIDSVLAQDYPRVQLVVVDDGSTDATAGVLDGYGTRITRLRQDRAGAYAARNLGLTAAEGELVAFMDSDDLWLTDKLSRQVPLMADGVGLVYGNARLVGSGSPRNGSTCFDRTPPASGWIAAHLVRGNCVPTVTVLARRACLEDVGGFVTTHPLSADYVAWFRIAQRWRCTFVDEVVADYTVHADGISNDLGKALQARLELFSAELALTSDPVQQALIRRLVCGLGVLLLLAVLRGRADRRMWRQGMHALRVVRLPQAVQCTIMIVCWRLAARAQAARRRGPS